MKVNSGLIVVLVIFLASAAFSVSQILQFFPSITGDSQAQDVIEGNVQKEEKEVPVAKPPESYILPPATYVAQTFNNCGPASLSMALSLLGKEVSQEVLASEMRPFNNPYGGVDDKSIFVDEFVSHAQKQGVNALHRPNGTIQELKYLTANGFPVVVRTWLNPIEDIGHFRVVRGYDNSTESMIVDDSYNGPNLSVSYSEFESMWKPFNYGYILVYPREKQALVEAILAEEYNEENAWRNALHRAEKELSQHPDSPYAKFNMAVAYYHLGDFQKSVELYEESMQLLPGRMLWYQLEPIQAYLKLGKYDQVFALTDNILNNGNSAYSELYQMRGEAYLAQGNKEAAREEFEKAVYYNRNFLPAQEALKRI